MTFMEKKSLFILRANRTPQINGADQLSCTVIPPHSGWLLAWLTIRYQKESQYVAPKRRRTSSGLLRVTSHTLHSRHCENLKSNKDSVPESTVLQCFRSSCHFSAKISVTEYLQFSFCITQLLVYDMPKYWVGHTWNFAEEWIGKE
jgi:hypothetical protein